MSRIWRQWSKTRMSTLCTIVVTQPQIHFFILFFLMGWSTPGIGTQRTMMEQQQDKSMGLEMSGLYPGPYFDLERNHVNVSAHVGATAYLPCYVRQLGNKSVSWIRIEDGHIVTVDRFIFIADGRFQVLPVGESWTLQIKSILPNDTGGYECQISTEPKLAFRIQLNVMVPTIRMDSSDENLFVWEGSQVQLRCIIQNALPESTMGKVEWFKNDRPLGKFDPFSSSRDTSSSNNNNKYLVFQRKVHESAIIEMATFTSVRKLDGGNYTCKLLPIGQATISLHVLNGENPAAMHHGKSGGISSSTSSASSSSSSSSSLLLWGINKPVNMMMMILPWLRLLLLQQCSIILNYDPPLIYNNISSSSLRFQILQYNYSISWS